MDSAGAMAAPIPPTNSSMVGRAYPWSIPSSSPSFVDHSGNRVRAFGELRSPDGNSKINRDPVDPSKLRLTYLYQPQHSPASFSPLPLERWTFFIQMPRMYPHAPPAVIRVSRETTTPGGEDVRGGYSGWGSSPWGQGRASAAIVASSGVHSHTEPPVPEQIMIMSRPIPHYLNDAENAAGNSNGAATPVPVEFDVATCVYNDWSPISTLGDLIDFLTGIPSIRREKWTRQDWLRHEQDPRNPNCAHARMTPLPVGHPTISPSSSDAAHMLTDMDDGDDLQAMADDSMSGHTLGDGKHTNVFLNPNRFDMGYDRGTTTTFWGMR